MLIYPGMKEFKVALFIGRFQPFHNGHLYSLNKCLELADEIIVGVGSSQESSTDSNPWNFEIRKKMIASVNQGVQIVAIPDVYNDKKWGDLIKEIIKKTGYDPSQVVGVGNNEWTNRILRSVGVTIFETGLYKRDELEGIKIRTLMAQNDQSWKVRVPDTVVKCLEDYDKSSKN